VLGPLHQSIMALRTASSSREKGGPECLFSGSRDPGGETCIPYSMLFGFPWGCWMSSDERSSVSKEICCNTILV